MAVNEIKFSSNVHIEPHVSFRRPNTVKGEKEPFELSIKLVTMNPHYWVLVHILPILPVNTISVHGKSRYEYWYM